MTAEQLQQILAAVPALEARLSAVEDERAVRNALARYMALCDQPCGDRDFPQLGDLFTEDAIWEGVGELYAETFGIQNGRTEIVAFVGSHLAPHSSHFKMNAHLLTSDAVQVDGDSARGQWLMLQASSYADNHSELIGARLTIDFKKQHRQNQSWQISHFRTQRLFCSPFDPTIGHLSGKMAPRPADQQKDA
jgi:hypothetical protein